MNIRMPTFNENHDIRIVKQNFSIFSNTREVNSFTLSEIIDLVK